MAIRRKNGNYFIDYSLHDANGRHRIREKVGPCRREAERALSIRMAEIAQRKFNIKSHQRGIPFNELANQYLEYSKAAKRSYKRDITSMYRLSAFFGKSRLDQVTSEMIEKYKIQRREEVLGRPKYRERDPRDVPMATINRELACLKHMFSMAIRWRKAEHNPVKGVKLFREENTFQRILSEEEAWALLVECPPHTRDIVNLALNTGMRRSEILNLMWEHVDLKRGYITVVKTKSGKQRVIPLNRTAWDMLLARPKDGIFVFHNDGKAFGSVKKSFATAVRKAGLDHCRFHDLRHTFATNLSLGGTSLSDLKELLGHSTIVMTSRYAHPTPDSKRAAVEMLDDQKALSTGHFLDTQGKIDKIKFAVSACK